LNVRNPLFSRKCFVFLTICLAAALSVPLSGQEVKPVAHPIPAFQDWSTRHLVYTSFGEMRAIQSAAHDPRAMFGWRQRIPLWPVHGLEPGHRDPRARAALQRDWSINLGVAGTAPAMYPAKFRFDVTTPLTASSCTTDFAVFPVNAPGGSVQPNIVAFDHLYSGGVNGFCNRTVTGSDIGNSAEVAWSYNIRGIAGGAAVTTSPVFSYDPSGTTPNGAKVAFVESTGGGQVLSTTVPFLGGGLGYAAGSTGTIAGGTGALATYQVTAVGLLGNVTALTITYPGTGYTTTNGVTTTTTSGGGTGLTLNITASSSSAAHFHVLAWKTGNGQNASNLQSVLTPLTISIFTSTAPAAGSGMATDLALGASTSGTDTLSSPFVDYSHDVAYVGNDIGMVYRIKDVFCTGINPDCAGATPPAPSLDGSWGTGGEVTIGGTCAGATGKLTGPVLDFVSQNVYVGCADGELYQISPTGTVTSLAVGDGQATRTYGGIVDPPVVDSVNGFVYAVSGSASSGANGVLVQAKVGLTFSVAVPIGAGNQCNMHAPALNNAYYTSPTSAGALIYVAGVTGTVGPCTATGATGGTVEYYAVTFGGTGVMTSGAPANSAGFTGHPGNELAPLAEFFNPNLGTGGEDLIFLSAITTGPDIAAFNVAAGFPGSAFAAGPATEGFGTSGIVIDNESTSNQASSIYFNALAENAACTGNTGANTTPGTGGCAVKLTQSALQ
jgi:hypothetical protein